MSRVISLFASFVMIVSVSACGIGGTGTDEYTDRQRRDAKALQERFDRVRGTYEGTIANPTAGGEPMRAKLILYVVNVRENANPDGSIRIRPALFGRFQMVDVVTSTDYLSLSGDYDDLGSLSLTSLTSGAGGSGTGGSGTGGTGSTVDALAISMRGRAMDGQVDAEVLRNGGYWGEFHGTRTTTDVSAPSTTDGADYRDRLRAMYARMEGDYVAILDGGPQRPRVSMTMTIGEDASGTPQLIVQYRRLDVPPPIGERQLSATFDSTNGRITMLTVAGGGSIPGSSFMSASGTWIRGELNVVINDSRGLLGYLRAQRSPFGGSSSGPTPGRGGGH